jgi:CRP-like cAMP-binding protein
MQNAQVLTKSMPSYNFRPLPTSLLFNNLDQDEVAAICELHASRHRSERDAQLVRAGDPAAPLLTIISGWAFRYSLLPNGRRQILSVNLPGDTIGLDTLLTGAPAYPVRSAGAVTYYVIDHVQAAALAREAPWFRRQALEALSRDRAAAEAALTRLGQCNAEERVAAVFLELYERLAERGLASNGVFTLELTQLHLANLVGLTAVHFNRVLKRLVARGLLSLAGHRVTLPTLSLLECLAPSSCPFPEVKLAS